MFAQVAPPAHIGLWQGGGATPRPRVAWQRGNDSAAPLNLRAKKEKSSQCPGFSVLKVAVATFSDEVKVRRRAILEYLLVLLPKDPLIPPTWRPRFAAVRRNNSPLDALWCCVDQGNTGTLQE